MPLVAEPPIEYVRSVSAAATALCVTVNCPSVLGSAAGLVVVAMLTKAVSLSLISTVSLSLATSMLTPGLLAVMLVRVTITSSVPSTIKSTSTVTSMVAVVLPAGTVTVPERAV